jgi:30S ribosomal protein S31
MGKGDQRSRRGKIWRGTSGKARPKQGKKIEAATEKK